MQLFGLFSNGQGSLVGYPVWVCICKSSYHLAVVQTTNDVAYELVSGVQVVLYDISNGNTFSRGKRKYKQP